MSPLRGEPNFFPRWFAKWANGHWYTVRDDTPHKLYAIPRNNEMHALATAEGLNLLDARYGHAIQPGPQERVGRREEAQGERVAGS